MQNNYQVLLVKSPNYTKNVVLLTAFLRIECPVYIYSTVHAVILQCRLVLSVLPRKILYDFLREESSGRWYRAEGVNSISLFVASFARLSLFRNVFVHLNTHLNSFSEYVPNSPYCLWQRSWLCIGV